MSGKPARMMEQTCPICGEITLKLTTKTIGQCDGCKMEAYLDRQRRRRAKLAVRKTDDGLMPWSEIAKELGYKNVSSVIWIAQKGMKKLRKLTQPIRDELRSSYIPDPEPAKGRVYDKPIRISQLPMSRFPLMPRSFK